MAVTTRGEPPAAQKLAKKILNAAEYTTDGVISVFVGRKRKEFTVHKLLICAHSAFFKSCFEAHYFKERNEKGVYLAEDDPDAFSVIINWLYGCRALKTATNATRYHAYILADKLIMTQCKNDIIDSIRSYHRAYMVCGDLLMHLPESLFDSELPLRDYIVDELAWGLINNVALRSGEKFNLCVFQKLKGELGYKGGAFVFLVLEKVLNYHHVEDNIVDPALLTGCQYHQHGEGEVCRSGDKKK